MSAPNGPLVDPLGNRGVDRRLDDLDLLAAEQAAASPACGLRPPTAIFACRAQPLERTIRGADHAEDRSRVIRSIASRTLRWSVA